MKRSLIILSLLIYTYISQGQAYNNLVSLDIKHQALKNKKLFTVNSQTLYNGKSEEVTSHYISPTEFFKTINNKGEVTLYLPKENTVSFSHNNHYSSKNELIYYFVSNKTEDMGLKNDGFTVISSRNEKQNFIVTWKAPVNLNVVSEVDIVYENMVPIYSEYRELTGEIIKKIYYYDYYFGSAFNIPQKITEISFVPNNDSIIKRTTVSNIKYGNNVDLKSFEFNIPSDATKLD